MLPVAVFKKKKDMATVSATRPSDRRGPAEPLYRAWEKRPNIVLGLKSKEATLLLFLLSSLFCTLSAFIRSALRPIFNGALGAKEMSGLPAGAHARTRTRARAHTHTQGYTWA